MTPWIIYNGSIRTFKHPVLFLTKSSSRFNIVIYTSYTLKIPFEGMEERPLDVAFLEEVCSLKPSCVMCVMYG